jgi:hypothetical protein
LCLSSSPLGTLYVNEWSCQPEVSDRTHKKHFLNSGELRISLVNPSGDGDGDSDGVTVGTGTVEATGSLAQAVATSKINVASTPISPNLLSLRKLFSYQGTRLGSMFRLTFVR